MTLLGTKRTLVSSILVFLTRRCTYPNSLALDRSCGGADGGNAGCVCSCMLFLVFIGIAEAMAADGAAAVSEGGDGDRPAGEATEVGNM